jgi:hypothetical protein
MRLNLLVGIFSAVWMCGALLGAVAFAVGSILERNPLGLVAFGFPIFGVALIGGGFAFDARKAEELLRAALPAVEEYRYR